MCQLRLSHLIVSAQSAIRAGTPGIQRGYIEPLVLYPDGSTCLFAAALPRHVLQRIMRDGEELANWLKLKTAGYFDIDSLITVEALTAFQVAYDACCAADSANRSRRTEKFFRFIFGLDPARTSAFWTGTWSQTRPRVRL